MIGVVELNSEKPISSMKHPYFREVMLYLATAGVSLILVWWVLKLGSADWQVPLHIPGDGLYYAMLTKTLLDTGWVYHNPYLSAPFDLSLYDFPHFDYLQLALMKLIGCISSKWGVVLNVYFVLTFPLTAVTSLVLFRWLKFDMLVAAAMSLLFAFQPYHFLRGQEHVMLSSYFLLPLIVLIVLWLSQPRSLARGTFGVDQDVKTRNYRPLLAILICLAASSAGHYYACFGCFFFVVAGGAATFRYRQWMHLRHAILLCLVIVCGMAINLSPHMMYWRANGSNRDVSAKLPVYSEVYGLKIVQVLSPIPGHRVKPLSKFAAKYRASSSVVSDNGSSSAGLVSSIGFLVLIATLFVPRKSEPEDFSIYSLSLINIGAVLLATSGGFGTVMAYAISPQIHGYNRMSIFIALFGLITVGYLLNSLTASLGRTRFSLGLKVAVPILVLALGLLDQTSKGFIPDYANTQRSFYRDASLAEDIGERYPKGSMFFMLPLSTFPFDDGQIGYQHMNLYLHSDGLRWSDPAMLFRRPSDWQKNIAAANPSDMVRALAIAGFQGILIDDRLHRAEDQPLLTYLRNEIDDSPLHDQESRYVFDLRPFYQELCDKVTPEQLAQEREKILPKVELTFVKSFRPLERSSTAGPHWKAWRWCNHHQGTALVRNEEQQTKQATLTWTIYPASNEPVKASISSSLFSTEVLDVPSSGAPFSKSFSIPPGNHEVTIRCEGKPLEFESPQSKLWFRIEQPSLSVSKD
jgi:hypothetical protein